MKPNFIGVVMAVFALVLAACNTAQSKPQSIEQIMAEKGYTMGPSVERIQQFRVNGWNYVDREHLIVTVGASRKYLVSLRVHCNGLLGAEVIAFTNTVSHLTTFDTLLVQDSSSSIRERCPIESMNELIRNDDNPAS